MSSKKKHRTDTNWTAQPHTVDGDLKIQESRSMLRKQMLSNLAAYCRISRSRGYKTFFMLNSMSVKSRLLIKTKIPANKEVSCFKSLRCCIYHANKCYMPKLLAFHHL